MKNATIDIKDATALTEKLIIRTREGKLSWQLKRDGYVSLLGPNLRVKVVGSEFNHKGLIDIELVEFDPNFTDTDRDWELIASGKTQVPDKKLLYVSIEEEPSYGYDSFEEKNLANLLSELISLARRSALDVGSSMEKALDYLDKIAG